MITNANAVINPRAMVIKPFDAFVADSTVLGSWCPYYHAFRAQLDRID